MHRTFHVITGIDPFEIMSFETQTIGCVITFITKYKRALYGIGFYTKINFNIIGGAN